MSTAQMVGKHRAERRSTENYWTMASAREKGQRLARGARGHHLGKLTASLHSRRIAAAGLHRRTNTITSAASRNQVLQAAKSSVTDGREFRHFA
jgi:hypothetical protein